MYDSFVRYRISGSSLLAAMDQSSHVSYSDVFSCHPGDLTSPHTDDREQIDEPFINVTRERRKSCLYSTTFQVNDEKLARVDDRSGRIQPTVDIAEVLRCWTHALQRVHRQSLHLVYDFLSQTKLHKFGIICEHHVVLE